MTIGRRSLPDSLHYLFQPQWLRLAISIMLIVQLLLLIGKPLGIVVEGLSFPLSHPHPRSSLATQWRPPMNTALLQYGVWHKRLNQKDKMLRNNWNLYSTSHNTQAAAKSSDKPRRNDGTETGVVGDNKKKKRTSQQESAGMKRPRKIPPVQQAQPKTEEEILEAYMKSLKDETKIVRTTESTRSPDQRWSKRYQELQEYKAEHGDCLVPQTYHPNPALGIWVRAQRSQYSLWKRKKGKSYITPERIKQLERLGFVWDAKEAAWEAKWEELARFRDKYGHVNVSPYRHAKSEKSLALWVRNQRTHYSYLQRGQPEKSQLTPERIAKLEQLGFEWTRHEIAWMEKYELLLAFRKEFDHCNCPMTHDAPLSRWIAQQRTLYKSYMKLQQEQQDKNTMIKHRMNEWKIDLLNSIGFVWDLSDDNWWDMYDQLKAHRDEHGCCRVPVRYPENPRLGHWAMNQRNLCRQYVDSITWRATSPALMNKDPVHISGITKERLDALRELEFCWLPEPNSPDLLGPTLEPDRALSHNEPIPKGKKPFIPFPWDEI